MPRIPANVLYARVVDAAAAACVRGRDYACLCIR